MTILFIMNDCDAQYAKYEHTGVLNAPNRRAVEVELTPEQVVKIGKRKLGHRFGKDITETIESVSLITKQQ